jgi:DNA-binding NarL/FixJ family response regulator
MDHSSDQFRILVVDDHPLVRAGLRRALEEAPEQWRVLEAASGHEALDAMHRQRIDLIIVDLSMPGMTGFDLIRRVRAGFTVVRVLVLSMHHEQQYALRALRAGANGYLTKDAAATELVAAVRAVVTGRTHVPPHVTRAVEAGLHSRDGAPAHSKLSDREFEVLRRLVSGQRPSEIARQFHISIKTVSTHKARIFHKLGLGSMAALVRYAIAQGLDVDASLIANHDERPRSPIADAPPA